MSLPPQFLDEIRARVPLSRVIGRKVVWDLRRSNQAKGDWWAPCPFHGEKTASFHVDDQKGFYYCFGCHAKGDALTFLREAEGMEVTFHRAFDMACDLEEALEATVAAGCRRILTSGGRNTAVEGIDTLRALVAQAAGRIELMAGSGVNPSNVRQLAATGVDAVHFSARSVRPGLLWLANSVCTLLTICAPIGIADVAAGEGALQVWIVRGVVTNRKSSISLPSGDTACARTPAGQGWRSLNESRGQYFCTSRR